ncbi:MAG: hypothetical protein WCK98_08185 [bacterium]
MSDKEKKVIEVEAKKAHKEETKTESKGHEEKETKDSNKHKEEVAPEIKDFESFTEFLDFYLAKKAPQLPVGVKEFLVKVFPWVSLVGVVFGVIFIIPGILLALGLGALSVSLGAVNGTGLGTGVGLFVSVLFAIAQLALSIMALPGLFAKKKQGWTYAYYGIYLSAAGSLIGALVNGSINIVSPVIGFAIGAYFLFQLRKYYK